ncbi:hypothetical protein KTO58_27440 [Chitinophaga pendula]|uniref:DUF6029 family protein n=1 Tax=Chitinophaga TaxID=79328 RepID=UPI000BAFA7CA|nr:MULTISPECIES: DUF6029 family protein [Chitinophaga]ASZ09707.1 hypothetical protein CK934_01315 [Chitinophaga sp. MD30]UCJ07351.1 hypothetical protein KTO58_27440 [Chitinophaga pendula]
MKKLWLLLLAGYSAPAFAQEIPGKLSGGLETTHQYYVDDKVTAAQAPNDHFGSNTYFTLNYTLKNFYAGVQLEGYLPALQGYVNGLKGTKITHRFAGYRTDKIDITAGHFYEQYGNGLIFRTYEERQLGLDNVLDGVNVRFTPIGGIRFKASYGLQRILMDNGNGRIRGADLELDLLQLLGKKRSWELTVGGSYINRYQDYTGPDEHFPPAVNAYSGRLGISSAHYQLNTEYVYKSADPMDLNKNIQKPGSALYIGQVITTNKGLGIDLAFRRLESMDFRSDRGATDNIGTVNYLPAMTKLYTYALPNIYPYATQTLGEMGGKADIYYQFKRGTALGGKYGTKLSLTASLYHNLDTFQTRGKEGFTADFWRVGPTLLYRDLNVTLEKKWSPALKTILSYMNLHYNKEYIQGGKYGVVHANTAIADIQYTINRKNTIRAELQHLWTKDDEGNWGALLVEYSKVPGWSVFAGDMVNYQTKKIHYYNFGSAFTYKAARVSLSYGRQRAGLLCVGGICRMVPAYTGASLSFTYNF